MPTLKPTETHIADRMVVALSVDRHYAVGAAVAIASLGDHVPIDTKLDIWLLHIGLGSDHLRLLATAATRCGACLHVYELSVDRLHLPTWSDYISTTTFGRLYLAEILPPECRRVLYLDCDILVAGNLAEVWAIDLDERILGAVREPNAAVRENPKMYERLQDPRLDPRLPYFNAGVLLIDLAAWRLAHVGDRAVNFIEQYRPRLMDQDALNAVTAGRWLDLDPMWNVTTFWFRSRTRQRRYQRLLQRARIVHYVGHRKPWLRDDVWAGQRWDAYRRELDRDRRQERERVC